KAVDHTLAGAIAYQDIQGKICHQSANNPHDRPYDACLGAVGRLSLFEKILEEAAVAGSRVSCDAQRRSHKANGRSVNNRFAFQIASVRSQELGGKIVGSL